MNESFSRKYKNQVVSVLANAPEANTKGQRNLIGNLWKSQPLCKLVISSIRPFYFQVSLSFAYVE